MTYRAKPGQAIDDLDTPALLLDLDSFQYNLQTMADAVERASQQSAAPVVLRPHVKTHKCPEIARRQLVAGAIGVTCAKISEAEVMAQAGIGDILIANQVAGDVKISRLVDLAARCDLMIAVDDPENVDRIAAACAGYGVRLRVLVEVDIGMGRCGVSPGRAVLDLAQLVASSSHLTFMGLQAYEGHLVLTADPVERATKVREAFASLDDTLALLDHHGLAARIVSGGGTGTFDATGIRPGVGAVTPGRMNLPAPVTEIQAGSYVFMDSTYAKVRSEFRPALSVLSTVLSRASEDRLVADAGLKALTREFGLPQPIDIPGAATRYLSEEHSVVDLDVIGSAASEASARDDTATLGGAHLRPGRKIRFLPTHCCTTTNLYDQLHVVQDGVLVDIWPISARGCSQ